MKRTLFLILVLISFSSIQAQRADADVISTKQGDLMIQPVLHGSVVLSWNDQVIYVDPYGGMEKFQGLADPTMILITDIHGDHHNQKTLDVLKTENVTFVVPQAVKDKLPKAMQAKARVIGNGEKTNLAGITISAIPMYNLPEDETSRHPKGRGNGYVLTVGGKRIYLSGDTEDIPEMRSLKNIDVAFVCMNLPYTMNIQQAASAVNEFKPVIVYPYHYRGSEGLSDVEAFKELVNNAAGTEVRLRDWYSN